MSVVDDVRAVSVQSQRDRLAEVGERILPILDWLCGDAPVPDEALERHAAQVRAELSAVLFDMKHGEGQCE